MLTSARGHGAGPHEHQWESTVIKVIQYHGKIDETTLACGGHAPLSMHTVHTF